MGISPGVPSHGSESPQDLTPRIVARIIQAHNGQHTLGGMPGVPAAWLRAAALRSLGKYSLAETDVLRSANDANGASPAEDGSRSHEQHRAESRRSSSARAMQADAADHREYASSDIIALSRK